MIVVTGATGTVGRPLVDALADAGEEVTAVSRHAPDGVDGSVRYRRADLAGPGSLRGVLDGARALFLLLGGELLGTPPDARALLGSVAAAGVERVVLLSSQGAGTRPHLPSHSTLRAYEDAVRESGLQWTVLRPGGFASNTLMWAPEIRAHGTASAPFGDVALPFVDPADISAVAAAVLRYDGHAGRIYELTGPEPTTPRDRARAIGEVLGRPVRFVEQTPQEARAALGAFMPGPVVDGTLAILGAPLPAERRVSADIEAVLGRGAGSFAGWARRMADAFR